MNPPCSKNGCSKIAKILLFCGEKKFMLCNNHNKKHVFHCENANHTAKSVFKKVIPDLQNVILKELKEKIAQIKEVKSQFKKDMILTLNAFSIYYLDSMKILCKNIEYCENMLKNMLSKNKIALYHREVHDSCNHLNTYDINNDLELHLNNCLQKLNYEQIRKNLRISIDKLNVDFYLWFSKKYSNLDANVYYFKKNTKTLVKFNTTFLNLTRIEIQNIANQGEMQSICTIPNNKLFVSGGFLDSYLKSCFIIDLNDEKNIKKLPDQINRGWASATYYKEKVYIFGGTSGGGNPTKLSEFICLNDLKWNRISDLPLAALSTNVLLLDHKMLISGFPNVLTQFDIINNSYMDIKVGLSIDWQNMLVQDGDSIYLIGRKFFYISNLKNLYSWKRIDKPLLFLDTVCKPTQRGRVIYFVDNKEKIFSFNLSTFTSAEVIPANSNN